MPRDGRYVRGRQDAGADVVGNSLDMGVIAPGRQDAGGGAVSARWISGFSMERTQLGIFSI